jgi:hypothetical protein
MFDFIKNIDRKIAKKITMFATLALIIIGTIIFAVDWMSYKNITFKLSSETKSIAVYDAETYDLYSTGDSSVKPSGSLDKSGTLRLKVGTYYVFPTGNNVSTNSIELKVDSSKEVEINPYYSEQYLSDKFSGQIEIIDNIIKEKYQKIIGGYTIDDGTFYHYGDWYGGTLYSNPTESDGSDTYGIILHKVNGSWQIAAAPQIVFRYSEHQDIPSDVLDSVNQSVNDL